MPRQWLSNLICMECERYTKLMCLFVLKLYSGLCKVGNTYHGSWFCHQMCSYNSCGNCFCYAGCVNINWFITLIRYITSPFTNQPSKHMHWNMTHHHTSKPTKHMAQHMVTFYKPIHWTRAAFKWTQMLIMFFWCVSIEYHRCYSKLVMISILLYIVLLYIHIYIYTNTNTTCTPLNLHF